MNKLMTVFLILTLIVSSQMNAQEDQEGKVQFHLEHRFVEEELSVGRIFKISIPKIVISATLPAPYLYSPAYDNIKASPRYSLNIDPVTNKYYWEW